MIERVEQKDEMVENCQCILKEEYKKGNDKNFAKNLQINDYSDNYDVIPQDVIEQQPGAYEQEEIEEQEEIIRAPTNNPLGIIFYFHF